ncbi:putative Oxidoreductase [Seiridium unicorne]|uniref:Oxidoreductase n=1 Tax=Seiridium unicorne TaxID=138068 RepID=A0ABR2UZW7_9PEZI
MPTLRILVVGAGVAGPAIAYWLSRCGHQITVIERSSELRALGAQIDLRAQGIPVVKSMGLMPAIRERLVDEVGVAHVDTHGKPIATIMANASGKGGQSATSEYEIMRGDLVRILYNATKDLDGVSYIFGKSVQRFQQDGNGVTVWYEDGEIGHFEVLIGADGQGSRIRKAILQTSNESDPVRSLGVALAYWNIPRSATDSNIRQVYVTPNRWIFRRSHSPTETQAYFFFRDDTPETKAIPKASTEKQKEFWISNFQGAGWQTERFIEGMKTTDNFYCQEAIQIKTKTWSKGRVVLLGDAAHCPSPLTGMGTTSALVGAYVLAGEICRHDNNLDLAFANYDRTLRPFVDEIQKLKPFQIQFMFPRTQFGIFILYLMVRLMCWLRVPDLINRFSNEDKGGWRVPDYSELS